MGGGNMRVKSGISAVAGALLLSAAIAQPAAARTDVNTPAVSYWWDESAYSPSFDSKCGRYYIDYQVTAANVYGMYTKVTNAAGQSRVLSNSRYISSDNSYPVGLTSNLFFDGCVADGWIGPVVVTFSQQLGRDTKFADVGSAGITIASPSPQATIEVMTSSCASVGVTAASKFCASDNVLKLKGASDWAVGSRLVPYLHLYNRAGEVPLNVELFDHAMRNDASGTMYARPQPSRFTPGRYMLVAHNGASAGATCHVSNDTITCLRTSETHAVKTFTFQWDGHRVSDVKAVPQSKVSGIRL